MIEGNGGWPALSWKLPETIAEAFAGLWVLTEQVQVRAIETSHGTRSVLILTPGWRWL